MGNVKEFSLSLPDANASELASLLEDFQQKILIEVAYEDNVSVELVKSSQSTQDLGAMLGIVLGAKATIVLATGVSAWLKRNNQSRIRIWTSDGEVVDITNVESQHIAEVLSNLKQT